MRRHRGKVPINNREESGKQGTFKEENETAIPKPKERETWELTDVFRSETPQGVTRSDKQPTKSAWQ